MSGHVENTIAACAQADEPQHGEELGSDSAERALLQEIEQLDREASECFARGSDADAQARGLRALLGALPRKLPQAAAWSLRGLICDARRARKVLVRKPNPARPLWPDRPR